MKGVVKKHKASGKHHLTHKKMLIFIRKMIFFPALEYF